MNMIPLVALALALPAGEEPIANPLFQELAKQGVVVGAGKQVRLSPPLMPDGLDGKAQAAIIKRESVQSEYRYDDVMEKEATAPHGYKDTRITDSNPKAPAYKIQVWFVAYGDLEVLRKKEPQDLFNAAAQKVAVHLLTPEELAQRGITLSLKPPLRERFVNTVSTLLNRVELSTTGYTVASQTAESIVVASKLDSRFDGDKTYANRYRLLDDNGNPIPPWQRYEGSGSYLKITRLAGPRNALFVEMQQITTEPVSWFNGAPVLRGKLPLMIKNEVQSFRKMALKTLPPAK
jgi:hypothetical protein